MLLDMTVDAPDLSTVSPASVKSLTLEVERDDKDLQYYPTMIRSAQPILVTGPNNSFYLKMLGMYKTWYGALATGETSVLSLPLQLLKAVGIEVRIPIPDRFGSLQNLRKGEIGHRHPTTNDTLRE